MTWFRIAPLALTLPLLFALPATAADQESPMAVAQAYSPATTAAETGLGAWPIAW